MSFDESSIHSAALNTWKETGIQDFVFSHLDQVNKIEQDYKKGIIKKPDALNKIEMEIDPVFKQLSAMVDKMGEKKINDQYPGISVLGEGVFQLPANNSHLTATFVPHPMDIVTVAYGEFEGVVFSAERTFRAKNLKSAFEVILDEQEMSIVDLLFGKKQMSINEWFENSAYLGLIENEVNKTLRNFKEMLSRNKFTTPNEITLFMSGISVSNPQHYSPYVLELIKKNSKDFNFKVKPDLRWLGEDAGWIYGGFNNPEYSVPVAYYIE